MSFKLPINEKDRASGRFMMATWRGLVRAMIEAKKDNPDLTQAAVAERLGVDRSSISRILKGKSNLTLRTLGEIGWASGLTPVVEWRRSALVIDGKVLNTHKASSGAAYHAYAYGSGQNTQASSK